MITVRRVGSPDYLTPNVVTGPAQRAAVDQRAELPGPTPAWWWGVAPGALLSPGNTAGLPVNTPGSAAPPAAAPGDPSSGCCG